MKRLTVNKDIKDMTTQELAYNCCYIKNGEAVYRDFDKELCVRDFIRNIMVQHGFWKKGGEGSLADQELTEDGIFDSTMYELLQFSETDKEGLTALLYRILCAMAELRDTLKEYEDTGLYPEQIRMLHSMYLDRMEDIKRLEDYYVRHRQQCGNWKHGEP